MALNPAWAVVFDNNMNAVMLEKSRTVVSDTAFFEIVLWQLHVRLQSRAKQFFSSRHRQHLYRPMLAGYLQQHSITGLVVTGAVAGFCVNSTVREGADLGFNMTVVRDAVIGFDLPSAQLPARTIFDVIMAHIESDFATVIDTAAVLAEPTIYSAPQAMAQIS